jgi:predicted acylesterase/phospholipase RssA
MNATGKLLASLPLFSHCLADEIDSLQKIGDPASVKKGHNFDLRKINSFNVISGGMFEIEAMAKTDAIFLAPGSFFGTLPFTERRQAGKIKALADSTILIFRLEDLYKFFLKSYKCLRGYLKIAGRMGFEVSGTGGKYFGTKSKIITVCAPGRGAGKSFLASLLALSLCKGGKTVVLDACLTGNSIFNFFEKKITTPLSQRSAEGTGLEQMINEWIVPAERDLDLINITFGSKVKADPDILSPLLFILSKGYTYIVIDSSGEDIELRNRIFGLSDQIFNLVKNRKEIGVQFDVYDRLANEGQRVYYVINERFAGQVRDMTGGFVLPRFDVEAPHGGARVLSPFVESESIRSLAGLITKKRRAIVFETNLLPALYYGGFLRALFENEKKFDLYYASSYGYIVLSLFLVSGSPGEFNKWLAYFFSEERINKLLDIAFPTEHVFKNNLVLKLAEEICGSARIEMRYDVPLALLGQDGTKMRRLFSTGYLRDILAASFCMYPLFEQVAVAGVGHNSGYPDFRARVEDLFRNDVDETVCVSVDNGSGTNYPEGKIFRLFGNYLRCADERRIDGNTYGFSDIDIALDASVKDFKISKILDASREQAEKLVSNID